MASIFDNFSTLRLTPEELKQLQLYQSGQASAGGYQPGKEVGARYGEFLGKDTSPARGARISGYLNADPVSTQTGQFEVGGNSQNRVGMDAREVGKYEGRVDGMRGQYLGPEQPVGRANRLAGLLEADPVSTQDGTFRGEYQQRPQDLESSRPRIGADPVSTQQQSRTGPARGGRTFYANTAGDVGTSVPRGSGTSGIYGAVEDAVGKGAGSVLRTAGKVLGPVGVLADLANPEALGNGELTPEQQAAQARGAVENMGPQMAGDAVQFAQDVSKRTLDAGLGRTPPVSLMDPQAPRGNLFDQSRSPRTEAVTETPFGAAAEVNPTTVPQAAAKTAQDQESQRQILEQGAVKGLASGEVTRSELAQEVVKSDAARAGKELTPEQLKAATATELTAMKSMDNNDLGKYISYALIAGGALATVFDKSGKSADMFASSFNKQLDRNLQAGLMNKKQEAANAKAAQDLKVELLKLEQTSKRNDIYAQSVDNTGQYQQGQLALGGERNDISRQGQAAAGARSAASMSLRERQMAQQQAQFEDMMGWRQKEAERAQGNFVQNLANDNARTAIAAKDYARKAKGGGIDLTTKDAEALVKDATSAQNLNLGAGAKTALSQQVRAYAKKNPDAFAKDPAGAVYELINQGGQYEQIDEWGNNPIRVKKRKDLQ